MARSKSKTTKRYIKFLSVVKNPKIQRPVLATAPNPVIKAICDAALNAMVGDVRLTPAQKKHFKKQSNLLGVLADKATPIDIKRKRLLQRGGFSFLPILLSTVLSSLGGLLFKGRSE